MIILKKITLFHNPIQNYYASKVALIGMELGTINASLSPTDLQKIKDQINRKIGVWAKPNLLRNSIKAAASEVVLDPDQAMELLFPGTTSIEVTNFKAFQAIYSVPISDLSDFSHGIPGESIQFYGTVSHRSIDFYEFTDKEIDKSVGESLRSKLNAKLDRIESNIKGINEFLFSKEEEFKELVSRAVDERFEKEKKQAERNSFL